MSKALSVDLRTCALAAVSAGASQREAAKHFGVSAASVSRWRNLQIGRATFDPVHSVATQLPETEAHAGLIMV
jgi:transposase-like protein